MRDNEWLREKLEIIWKEHFSDIERKNPITIKFGRRSKRRLGSIVLDDKKISNISLTGYFTDEAIPEYILFETIAHELIHYIHGFSSTIERKFSYPHQGGIIVKEMKARGLYEVYRQSKQWMSLYWQGYILSKVNPIKKKKNRSIIKVSSLKKKTGLWRYIISKKFPTRKRK